MALEFEEEVRMEDADSGYWTVYNGKRSSDRGLQAGEVEASEQQVGGNHYRGMVIQPSEFIHVNELGWCEGNAVKYICRHHLKGGEGDLDKAIHYLQLLKEWDYGEEESILQDPPF